MDRSGRELREWLFLVAALLLVAGLFSYESSEEHRQILADEKTRLTTLSQVLQEQVSRQIESIDITLRNLSQQSAGDSHSATQLLQTLTEAMPGVRNILMLDAAGNVTASNHSAFVGKNFATRDYFRIPQADGDAGKLFVIPPFRNSQGIWTIPLVRIIPGTQGQFAGIVAASIEAQELVGMLDAMRYSPDFWSYVAHVDGGVFVARPERRDLTGMNIRNDPDSLPSRHVASGQAFSLQQGIGAVQPTDSLVAIRDIRPTGIKSDKYLLVGLARSTEGIYARWHHEVFQHVLMIALLVCVCVASLFFFQRRRRAEETRQNEYQAHLENIVAQRTAQLSASEAQLRQIIESTGDGMIGMDSQGNASFVNPAACAMLGYAPAQLLGRNVHDTLHYRHPDGTDYPAQECLLMQHVLTGKILQLVDDVLWRADGSPLPVTISSRPILRNGKVTGGVLTFSDNTERQQVAAVREKALQAAEAANRAKTAFLANMSHELRTPMNAIIGMTQLALRRSDDPQLLDQLDKVSQASQHLLSIINSVLDISKIESENFAIEQTAFCLDEVIGKLDNLIRGKVAEKGLDYTIDVPKELRTQPLIGDPLRLGQVLINLVGNAVKFTSRGSIHVSVRSLREDSATIVLRWEVIDSGIGIAPEDQSRIFTSFEQADNSMTRKYGGTGLGLAISRRLLALMGGEIGIVSTPGQGSTFWFTCRCGKAVCAVPPEPTFSLLAEADIPHFTGLRALLVEDEVISQEVLRGLLEDTGLMVDSADDGQAAVARAQASHYDIVLMDMQMPKMNGPDATRAIRALPGYADTPILATTANAFESDRQACLDAGMNEHLTKPINPTTLYAALCRWLQH